MIEKANEGMCHSHSEKATIMAKEGTCNAFEAVLMVLNNGLRLNGRRLAIDLCLVELKVVIQSTE